MNRLILLVAQGLGTGRSPKAPGTVGTLLGLPLFILLLLPGNFWLFIGMLVFLSYASCELKSRFQYAGRLATDAASSSSRNLSTPATRCDAMSPSRVSGFVSSLGWAFRCSAQKSSDGRSVIFFMDRASSVGRQPCLSRQKRLRRPTRSGPLRCSRRGRPAGHPSSRPSPWASTGLARLATAWRCQKRGRAG